MPDAAPPKFRDGRMHPGGAAVAAVVVGQHGHIDPGVTQCVGQRRRRAETGIARIAVGAGERRFEVHDHQIGRTEAAVQVSEHLPVVEPRFAAGRRDLRQMLHHVAPEQQPHAHRLGRRKGRLPLRLLRRNAARRRQQQPRKNMSSGYFHGMRPKVSFPYDKIQKPHYICRPEPPSTVFAVVRDAARRRPRQKRAAVRRAVSQHATPPCAAGSGPHPPFRIRRRKGTHRAQTRCSHDRRQREKTSNICVT